MFGLIVGGVDLLEQVVGGSLGIEEHHLLPIVGDILTQVFEDLDGGFELGDCFGVTLGVVEGVTEVVVRSRLQGFIADGLGEGEALLEVGDGLGVLFAIAIYATHGVEGLALEAAVVGVLGNCEGLLGVF